MIYIVIILGIAILGFFEINGLKPSHKSKVFWFLWFILVFFAGTRHYVGPDYGYYHQMYSWLWMPQMIIILAEPLFTSSMFLANISGLSFFLYLFIVALISITIKFRAFKEYSPLIICSVLLYYVNYIIQDFGQIRQGLAIAICFYNIKHVVEEKFGLFFTLLMVSVLIHFTSIIFIFLYFVKKWDIRLHTMLFVWIACFGLSLLFSSDILISLSEGTSFKLFAIKLMTYGSREEFGGRVGLTLGMIIRIIVLSHYYFRREEINIDKRLYLLFLNGYFFGSCLYFLFNFNEILSLRLTLYYICFEMFMIPQIINSYQRGMVKSLVYFFWVLYILYVTTINVFFGLGGNYLPYKSILFS